MAAPGPWGEPSYPPYSRPQHSPPANPHVHPYAAVGVQRQSFYGHAMQQPAIPGFYNPAIPQPRPATPPSAGAPPAFPQPRVGLPPSLVPGRRSMYAIPRSQSNDLFFQNEPPPVSPPLRHSQTAPAPPLPWKPDFSQPPLPPKPSMISPPVPGKPFASDLNGNAYAVSPPAQPATFAPSSPLSEQHPDEDAVLNRVLELSAQETCRFPQASMLSEEEQMARALEESMRISSSQSMSSLDSGPSTITSSPEQNPSVPPVQSMPELALSGPFVNGGVSQRVSVGRYDARQISADEVFARQLAEEEERLMQQEEAQRTNSPQQAPPAPNPTPAEADPLPQYDEAVSSPPTTAPHAFYNASLTAHMPVSDPGPSRSGSPPQIPPLVRSVSDRPAPPKSITPPDQNRPLGRSQSFGDKGQNATQSHLAPAPTAARRLSIVSTAQETDEDHSSSPSSHSPTNGVEILSNTQYLDAELLAGLSMNFGTPPIDPSLKPFAGVIPNVIALPYGRTMPFYIKAPSWRNLLKLMARLSGTRIEPTMEAIAVVKSEMKLRVVVSFVKVHQTSTDWHTVLYMTIDHAIPPNAPTGWKYRNGDTSTLPWSYTLSQVPAFLRDGSDAALSKFYTIPASTETPLPVLPISFPNLATYLAATLEYSREAMHDGSSGVRRLAKYVDQFYPSDRPTLDDAPERGGMRRRLKNLVGMGNKPQRDRNAEMYELVTPFVPDEFGR